MFKKMKIVKGGYYHTYKFIDIKIEKNRKLHR